MQTRLHRMRRRLTVRLLRGRRRTMAWSARVSGHARRADQGFMIVAAIVIGLAAGGGAIGFRHLIQLSRAGFFQSWSIGIDTLQAMPWWQRLLIPALGGLLVGPLVRWVASEVRGSGVPEVMESVTFAGGLIRARVIVVKAVAAALTIGSGGSAGREGPIIQIGSSIGSATGQILSVNPVRMRIFVACGAAAGIAATFNAPIAGALFAVEVILGEFAVAQFSPIVIASVTATVLSRHYLGDVPAFEVPAYELLRAAEFLPYSALGVLAGLSSAAFIWMVYSTQDLMRVLVPPLWLRPAIGGLLVGAIAVFLPQVFGVGYGTLHETLWGRTPLLLLLLLIPAKMAATSATLGSAGSGGIFAPSLFIGAMLGGAVGHFTELWLPGSANAGAYALVGMGALVAGATHAPISAILIIFELTGDYKILPPLMVACIVSVLLARWLLPHSMYTLKLAKRGINLQEGNNVNVLRRLSVGDVLDAGCETMRGRTTIHQLIDKVVPSKRVHFFVVNRDHRLLGSFSLRDLRELLVDPELPDLIVAADVARSDIPTVHADDNLDLVMHLFGQHDLDEIAVVGRGPGRRLLGSVRRKDIIDAYNKEIFRLDLAGGFHSLATSTDQDHGVDLLAGFRLVEVKVPPNFVGKTIRQVNIRELYRVEVILIRNSQTMVDGIPTRPGAFPHGNYRLKADDGLLVMGSRRDIRHFCDALPTAADGGGQAP